MKTSANRSHRIHFAYIITVMDFVQLEQLTHFKEVFFFLSFDTTVEIKLICASGSGWES